MNKAKRSIWYQFWLSQTHKSWKRNSQLAQTINSQCFSRRKPLSDEIALNFSGDSNMTFSDSKGW